MKQVVQDLRTGTTQVVDAPDPVVRPGTLLIATRASLISAGTERMMLDFGRGNYVQKALQQPDKVRQVLDKARTDGLLATVEAVQSKLDEPFTPGYCNFGTVLAVGEGVSGYAVGDRVASNGAHADRVVVPQHLCAPVPDGVDDEAAAFTVVSAIALQGVRLAAPTIGERFVVTGLGLIGQLAVRVLLANGCRVLGIDPDANRRGLAQAAGAEVSDVGADVVANADRFSEGRGVDGVLITASTRSSEPVSQAARMSRKRGRIVLVGVTGLELSRDDFYAKELSFQVSCSYGPGRYEADYEEHGRDYPFGFVRWTEQRNFEAVLSLMASGRLDVRPLVTHRVAFDAAADAYGVLGDAPDALGIVLQFPHGSPDVASVVRPQIASTHGLGAGPASQAPEESELAVSLIGAGNYARRVLVPAFAATGVGLDRVTSTGGLSAELLAKKSGFREAVSDATDVMESPRSRVVIIANRHLAHAQCVVDALMAGKDVFVEKPLAITREQLDAVERAALAHPQQRLMVGFNRRFAPLTRTLHQARVALAGPCKIVITVNAGEVPFDHWTQDREVGGGRIVGEACHFVDLARYLAGDAVDRVRAARVGGVPAGSVPCDNATLELAFADGSSASIHYLSSGHRAFPKERVEVFAGGGVLQLDNFRRLRAWGAEVSGTTRSWRQDKGQSAMVNAFVDSVRNRTDAPIPLEELLEVSRVTLDLADELG